MSLRSIFSRPVFFVSFVVFVAMFFVLGSGVQGFDFFKSWTTYQNIKIGNDFIKLQDIQTPAVGTVLAQLKVGNNDYLSANSLSDSLSLYDQTQTLVDTDILQLIKDSDDPQAVYDLHLAQMQGALDDIHNNYDSLMELSADKNQASQECLTKKKQGDQQFFEGVNESDTPKYQEGLDESLEFAPCYITNRIESNAYAYLASRITAYQQVLSQRNQVLDSRKDALLQSYPLLQGNVAEELVQLKNQLNTVNKTSFENVGSIFNFGVPELDTLPGLERVWFRDNQLQVPNFVDPVKGLGSK